MCRLLLVVPFVCSSLSVLFVYGRTTSNAVIFPDSQHFQFKHGSSISYFSSDFEQTPSTRRYTRQNNRHQVNRNPPPFMENGNDPFEGLDPQQFNQGGFNSNNNRPSSGNQNQGFNNGNQNFNQGFGNRPQNQNQWSNNGDGQGQGNFGNQGQSNFGNQGQGINGNNRPMGQNQWSNNGGSQGQGNNRPSSQNQWSNNGINQGQGTNRPTNENQSLNNQTQEQSSTASTNGSEDSLRNSCNMECKERITNEYNPVCGSDSLTYQNRRFLECVANCGVSTQFSYIGSCVTTTERNVRA